MKEILWKSLFLTLGGVGDLINRNSKTLFFLGLENCYPLSNAHICLSPSASSLVYIQTLLTHSLAPGEHLYCRHFLFVSPYFNLVNFVWVAAVVLTSYCWKALPDSSRLLLECLLSVSFLTFTLLKYIFGLWIILRSHLLTSWLEMLLKSLLKMIFFKTSLLFWIIAGIARVYYPLRWQYERNSEKSRIFTLS